MSAIARFENEGGHIVASPSGASTELLDALERTLLGLSDYHRLFDAKLIRVRHRMGLPVTQPTSLKDVPQEHEVAFREAYTSAAREVGQLFLKADKLADAWAYFRTIHEPEPVREVIAKRVAELPSESGPQLDEILNLALYEGAHVVEGLKLLLKTHGTCNTVTAMSQLLAQMSPEERRQSAAVMVQSIYSDLQHNVRSDLERRETVVDPEMSLDEMIRGREFLFADAAYHVDVSHLHSIVSFARHLHRGDPELLLAIELSEYGRQLAEHLRYPGDVPFDDYYVANQNFLKAVAGIDVDESMTYFIDRLHQETEPADKRMIAFVLVDLGQRVDRVDRALDAAAPYVSQLEDPNGFSFTAFCVGAGRLDILEAAARENDDVLALVTARLCRSAE